MVNYDALFQDHANRKKQMVNYDALCQDHANRKKHTMKKDAGLWNVSEAQITKMMRNQPTKKQ